jgi:hypothetical protein
LMLNGLFYLENRLLEREVALYQLATPRHLSK